MRTRSFLLAALSSLVLAACAAGPDYVAPLPPSPQATGGFVSAEAGIVTPSPLPADWWRLYDDPVLDTLVEDALRANTDLRQASGRIARARAALRGARADRLPRAGLSASPAYVRSSAVEAPGADDREGFVLDAGIDVSYEVDLFGRIGRGVEAAAADVDTAQADADAVRVIVVADTTRAYADVASTAARIAVARQIVTLLDDSLRITRLRHDSGLESGLAVARIEALRDQRAADIPALEAQRRAALFALATLTGRAPADLPPIAGERSIALEIAAPLPVGDGAAMLARRPDIRAAERRLAANTARIGVATADLYPRITLGGSVGSTATSLGDLLSGGALNFLVGPLIDWAFPNREPVRARIDAAAADADIALAAFDGTVLTALQEAEIALSNYARALDRRASLRQATAAAGRAAAITRARQREGIVNSLELLDAERTLAEASAALVAQDAEVSGAQIDLFRSLGGGWSGSG
ncbi:efflux transporter outer membrane subunit [Erythrobacter arachoides]|uniref:Efflux transporter outer membrane subunit n=1 Tax=Aurantiacibacter arachoides TaxID=1850444 RepID=A0A845A356_9SPHN|nr:TolC family protein [Aurantiacibacter arachoides]MXO94050.1 efflux transporter outer membrane subunit [Aurantiacibacter arachoides]GGD44476.1 outer membrane efflux protein [Aurantiacibacter arachoides]